MTIWAPQRLAERSGRPLYLAIAEALEADILAGRLRPGDRLPTHRDLAHRVGVTVGTVSRAYAEAGAGGWIAGEVGRGTFVLDRRAGRFPRSRADGAARIDLRMNVPVDEPRPDIAAAFRAILSKPGSEALLRYAPTGGDERDRLVGAAVLARHGLAVAADSVILCAGAQHGVAVAIEAVTQPGDAILAEELTYPGIRPLAEARGLRVHPVAFGKGDVGRTIASLCRVAKPKAFYVNPTLHNPTAQTLSAELRQTLAEMARRHGFVIVEDDVQRLLAPEAPAPIARLAPDETIYVASLSKCFAPGLRLGYVAAPARFCEPVTDAVRHSIWSVSPLGTALAAHWIEHGEFDAVVAGKRREATARQALAAKIFASHRPAGTAYHYWLEVPAPWTGEAFALEAQARGVLVTPGTAFHLGSGRPPNAVRISLSAAKDRATLSEALERLRQLADGTGAGGGLRAL
jgi:DNA-binding transcriptional MocR family regulator